MPPATLRFGAGASVSSARGAVGATATVTSSSVRCWFIFFLQVKGARTGARCQVGGWWSRRARGQERCVREQHGAVRETPVGPDDADDRDRVVLLDEGGHASGGG